MRFGVIWDLVTVLGDLERFLCDLERVLCDLVRFLCDFCAIWRDLGFGEISVRSGWISVQYGEVWLLTSYTGKNGG